MNILRLQKKEAPRCYERRDRALRGNRIARHALRVLHRAAEVRPRPLHRDRAGRADRDPRDPGRGVPRDRPAPGPGDDQLSGGGRPGGAGGGGRAHRGRGQRRRRHALHVLDQRQRRRLHADGHLRGRHGPRHRRGQRAEPGRDRAGPSAAGGGPAGDRHPQAVLEHADGGQPHVAGRDPRRAVPEQLRLDPRPGRAFADQRGGERGAVRGPGLRDAGVAGPEPAGPAEADRYGRRGRDPGAERAGHGRADRRSRPSRGRRSSSTRCGPEDGSRPWRSSGTSS